MSACLEGDLRRQPRGLPRSLVPELKAGAAEWQLLLQLDTEDDTGWMWRDVGTLYF